MGEANQTAPEGNIAGDNERGSLPAEKPSTVSGEESLSGQTDSLGVRASGNKEGSGQPFRPDPDEHAPGAGHTDYVTSNWSEDAGRQPSKADIGVVNEERRDNE